MSLRPTESLWVYRRGPVVMGFVLDRDLYVTAIALAGQRCDWARTANGAPQRQIKLGDGFQRLMNRYGYPETVTPYTPGDHGPHGAGAGPTVVGPGNASRNVIVHYGYNDNIEFTLMDLKVVRIHIWEPEMREPEARVEGGGGGMGNSPGGGPVSTGGGPTQGGPGSKFGPAGAR